MRRLGAFSGHFRPDTPVRKWHYDKGRCTQGRTFHPQSPAMRVFFGLRARYTFSRNSKFWVNPEPRNALVSRGSAVLCVCGGDDRNRHRKRKTHRGSCKLSHTVILGGAYLNKSKYTNYNDLPLMLSVPDVASVLGISRAGAYELVRSDGFPALRIGSRIVVPKEKFIDWVDTNTGA